MVKITLEYANMDEAILALGKLALPAQMPAAKAPAKPELSVPETPRKGRADKGKPRGPYKKGSDAPDAGSPPAPSSAPAAPAASEPHQAHNDALAPGWSPEAEKVAAPAPAEAPAKPLTEEEVKAALEKVFNAKGVEAAMALLQQFGVQRGRDIPEGKRAAFVAAAEKALA